MAASEAVQLVAELKKLNKDEIIDILINKVVPKRSKSDVLSKFVEELRVACELSHQNDVNISNDSVNTVIDNGDHDINTAFLGSQQSQSAVVISDLIRENSVLKAENILLRDLDSEKAERINLMKFKIDVLENNDCKNHICIQKRSSSRSHTENATRHYRNLRHPSKLCPKIRSRERPIPPQT